MTTHCSNCGHPVYDSVLPRAAIGDLTVSLSGQVWWQGKPVRITATLASAVYALATARGRVVENTALAQVAGSHSADTNRTAQSIICRIKRSFRAVDPGFDRLQNWHGRGYRWRVD
jgi:DNA-binding response OmpR family regulator